MAAAAYAALTRLSNLLMQIENHPRFSTFFDNNQIQYLVEIVEFLLDFVETYNSHGEAEDLMKHLANVTYSGELTTDYYMEYQSINSGSSEEKSREYSKLLGELMAFMDSIKKHVIEMPQKKQPTNSVSAASSRRLTSGKTNSIVGFDDELFQLMDLLTSQQPHRKIISIVGMGGIGKTTLARSAFESLLIKQTFDLCLWADISQECSVREILLQLLSFTLRKFTSETTHELGDQLYKSLYGRKYMIVLDDMWDINVWDKIKVFLPNNGTDRSGITITTRLSNVASHCSSTCITMKFLDEDKSWKLLCDKAFGEEDSPHELEEIGKEIVNKCRGLPLPIAVIGGHLRNSLRTKEYWLEVANDINSVLNSGDHDEQCLSILALSYSHLPAHLKPIFLHIGILSVDDETTMIDVSKLVPIWVAEGFLKQSGTQSLEEVAVVYIEDLLGRNLILVHELDWVGAISTFKIHDLLRDLCLRVVEKEKFHCELKKLPSIQGLEKLSDYGLSKIHFDTFTIEDEFGVVYPKTKFRQAGWRYLNTTINCFSTSDYSKPTLCLNLHSSISLLWNLQTLYMNALGNVRIMAPSEIWEMPNLRHLEIRPQICFPDPPPSDHQQGHFVLHNLQTLMIVNNLRLSEEVCKRIPNIKSLQLYYDDEKSSSSDYCLHNLCHFKQLKSLTCSFALMLNWSDYGLNLPCSLRKLSLGCRNLDCEHLTMITTMVPHLEVLELLFCNSNIGQFNGEFSCLKSLSITCAGDLIEWNGDKFHFPILEYLTLINFPLPEIPPGMGEIHTLRNMDLFWCSTSAAVSAVRILTEQEDLGNERFQLRLRFMSPSDEERFWKMVEEEDLTSNNVVVDMSYRTGTTARLKSRLNIY